MRKLTPNEWEVLSALTITGDRRHEMITPQKIQYVLRKAGFDRAVYHKSKQVRGLGTWSEGYVVTKREAGNCYAIDVYHQFASLGRHGDPAPHLDRYRDALVAAGFDVAYTDLGTNLALTIYVLSKANRETA